jgi:serine/threonine protein phosphatase PrpC
LLAHLFNHPVFLLDVEAAVRDTLKRIELNLFHKLPGLAEYSGTTLSMAIVRGSDIWAVNVGDSRIVLATKTPQSSGPSSSSSSSVSSPTQSTHSVHSTGSSMASSRRSSESRMSTDSSNFQWRYVAQDVTIDHKPHLPVEFARITSAGGRVFAIRYDNGEVGPPRVWLGTSNVPGLAMSRSLGDFMVHSVGVISTPDVFHYQLDDDCDCFLIVGTDGLWDTVKSQEAVNIVKAFDEAGKAVEGILRISHQRWMDHDHVSDDTSLCIVHLRGFTSSKVPR